MGRSGQWVGGRRDRGRLPGNWKAIRGLVFAAYGDVCHVCRQPGADDVDHVVAGDDHSLQNLRPIHRRPCHAIKSSAEGVAARRRVAAELRHPREDHPGLRGDGR